MQGNIFGPKAAVAALCCLSCLLPLLYFPISPDLAVFALGGQVILDGGAMYADFVDIKPPLVYYLLAAGQALFGTSELGVRLFDLIWQFGTCMSMYFVVRQAGYANAHGLAAACLYAFVYVTHSYASTMQCESFAIMPMLWAMALMSQQSQRVWKILVIGFLCGFVFSIKYPLGIILAGLLIWDVLFSQLFDPMFKSRQARLFVSRWLLILSGFIVGVFLFLVLPLMAEGAWEAFLLVFEFTLSYNSSSILDVVFIRETLKQIPEYLVDQFSLLMALGIAVVLFRMIGMSGERRPNKERELALALICLAVLLVSVVIERKMFAYHFSRALVVLVPLASIGLVDLLTKMRSSAGQVRIVNPLIMVLMITMAILFSPLPRYVNLLRPAVHFHSNPAAFDAFYERPGLDRSVIRVQQRELQEFVRTIAGAHEEVLVLSTHSAMINFGLQRQQIHRFPGMQIFAFDTAPAAWRAEVYAVMRRADFLVVQLNDRFDLVNATNASSAELLAADAEASGIISTRFRELRRFESFVVYRAAELEPK